MNKYFVKYVRIQDDKEFKMTRFFNTVDIEQEWICFSSLNSNPHKRLELVEITFLGKCNDY
jgi:hypothetical protein